MATGALHQLHDWGFLTPASGLVCGVLFTVVLFGGMSLVSTLGRLEVTVHYQQKDLDHQRHALDDMRRELCEIRAKPK